MKKNAKTAAVFGAAAVLSAGAAFTSLAAWQQEGDSWIYTDSRGDRVTDSWRQSGKYYYYLDNDGNLATDQWIDDTYYVDVNGVRAVSYTHLCPAGLPCSHYHWSFAICYRYCRYEQAESGKCAGYERQSD